MQRERADVSLPQRAARTPLSDTRDIYDPTSVLQIGHNCADTQWKQSGYKLCFMHPGGAHPMRLRLPL